MVRGDKMIKKLIAVLCIIGVSLSFYFYQNNQNKEEETFYIKSGIENSNIEEILTTNFKGNSSLTVGQLLIFYSRLYGNNVSTYQEAQEFCSLKDIYLPSDLVYNQEEWKTLWRNIVLGNTVFEKKNDDTYAINLIKGYLTIYLNEQGYECIKQGLIPPQLYFYSPFRV